MCIPAFLQKEIRNKGTGNPHCSIISMKLVPNSKTGLKGEGDLTRPKFLEGGLGKREVTFFKGVAIILNKNKLKSEYLMTKKFINKLTFFSVITKNSNWKLEPRIFGGH